MLCRGGYQWDGVRYNFCALAICESDFGTEGSEVRILSPDHFF